MRDRPSTPTHFFELSVLPRLKQLPTWVMLSLMANGILLLLLLTSLTRPAARQADSAEPSLPQTLPETLPETLPQTLPQALAAVAAHHPAERQQLTYKLTYNQWLDLLSQEAKVVAEQAPAHLSILAGDSLSLWFPNSLLPTERHWLNQGISGETSAGLLRRLDRFNSTQPQTIFVMIGINDLLRGVSDQTLLANHRLILQDLRAAHPQAQIVLQAILPHAERSNWEGHSRLLAISNQRIQALNAQLEEMARESGAYFLDLYPLFANPEGYLRPELSTDGLHLSPQGYQTWSIALQVYSREVLKVAAAP